MYNLEAERVSDYINRNNSKKVLIQLPDGLRPKAFHLVRILRERTDAELLLLGDSCYGACDIPFRQANELEADLLIHYGHSRMLPDTDIPVLYIELKVEINVDDFVDKSFRLLGEWRTVGLATTIQHIHQIGEIAETLRLKGIRTIIGREGERTVYAGQVLGCDYSSARFIADEVDGFLFIGGGRFHSLGLAMATGRPVIAFDPYISSVTMLGEEEHKRLAKKRMAAIIAAKKARRIGIIVSLKPGQFELSIARSLRDGLERQGKEANIICLDDIRYEKLGNFSEADAFIDTACPRIAIDGVGDLRRPILTIEEAHMLLGEKRWEEIWPKSYLG